GKRLLASKSKPTRILPFSCKPSYEQTLLRRAGAVHKGRVADVSPRRTTSPAPAALAPRLRHQHRVCATSTTPAAPAPRPRHQHHPAPTALSAREACAPRALQG